MHCLYNINLEKIKKGCSEKWFGSTDMSCGSTPQTIFIDKNEPLHFVQILFLLKESFYEENKWVAFTKKDLFDLIEKKSDNYIKHYMFGESFVDEFHMQINHFVKIYCDDVGIY